MLLRPLIQHFIWGWMGGGRGWIYYLTLTLKVTANVAPTLNPTFHVFGVRGGYITQCYSDLKTNFQFSGVGGGTSPNVTLT